MHFGLPNVDSGCGTSHVVYSLFAAASPIPRAQAEEALADANACVKLCPGSAQAAMLRVQLFSMLDQQEQAISEGQRLVEMEPDNPAVWATVAGVHFKSKLFP